MKMFIDTANVDHIREANDLGVICGVTTNPSLIAKEGRDFVEVVKEITTIVDGPISAEVISLDHEGMVKEARELVKISVLDNNMLGAREAAEMLASRTGAEVVQVIGNKFVLYRAAKKPVIELPQAKK